MRVTVIANRRIKRPVKLSMYPLVLSSRLEKPDKPVRAVATAKRKMTIPTNVCHGRSVPLLDISAPGKQ